MILRLPDCESVKQIIHCYHTFEERIIWKNGGGIRIYSYDTQESFNDKLGKDGKYGIVWYMQGDTLTKDKKAAYTVKLKISSEGKEYTRTGQSDLIIHKTVE